jgi:putative flippase GtrA
MKKLNQPEIIKLSKFLLVGFFNTLISFLTYYLLFNLGLFYLLASFLAYCAGLVNSYLWNLRWTFQKEHSGRVLIRFIIVNIIALSFKLLLLKIFVEGLNLDQLYSEGLAIIFSTILNFIGNNLWTFRREM